MKKAFCLMLVSVVALTSFACKKAGEKAEKKAGQAVTSKDAAVEKNKIEERIEKRIEQVNDARAAAKDMNKAIDESQRKAKEAMAEQEKK